MTQIPQAAVEAAARVLWDKEMNAPWSSVAEGFRTPFLRDAKAALEAAAPHMLAEAWDAGHNHCFHVEDPRNKERNPYRPHIGSATATNM